MTDKEKAKAYDDALEIAKNEINIKGIGETVELCERLFPELRGSEDERIRKVIYKLMLGMRKEIFTTQDEIVTKDKALAYLEKQKEQKPILEVFGFKVGDAVRLKDGDGRKHIIKSFEEVEGIHGPNFYHVEFEDNSARDGIYPGEEYPNGYYTQMEKVEEEQKSVVTHGETYHVDTLGTQQVIAGKMPQKPAEWSEEDETRRDGIIQWLREYQKEFIPKYDSLSIESIESLIAWLKSLRPSWKPSEEQMIALKRSISYLSEYGQNDDDLILCSLYKDLQKRYGTC